MTCRILAWSTSRVGWCISSHNIHITLLYISFCWSRCIVISQNMSIRIKTNNLVPATIQLCYGPSRDWLGAAEELTDRLTVSMLRRHLEGVGSLWESHQPEPPYLSAWLAARPRGEPRRTLKTVLIYWGKVSSDHSNLEQHWRYSLHVSTKDAYWPMWENLILS